MTRTGSKTIIAELTRTKADVEALLKAEIAAHERTKEGAAKVLAAMMAERDAAQAAFERAAIAEGEAIVARDAAQARVKELEAQLETKK